MYATIKATVRHGKIELLEDVELPEDAVVLITVLDDILLEKFTLGEHLIAGLRDILLNRTTEINTPQELTHYLDTMFDES